MATGAQGGGGRLFDVGDVGCHFCPHGDFRNTHHPAADFFKNRRILTHRRSHLALGQTMGAGKIQFEGIHARILAALDDFTPRVLVILFHHGGDEYAFGVGILGFLELVQPRFKLPIADQLDVFPADHLLAIARHELGIAGADVDDFRAIKTHCLGDHPAPAFLECALDHLDVGARRAGADHEGVGEFQAIDGGCQGAHDFRGCRIKGN